MLWVIIAVLVVLWLVALLVVKVASGLIHLLLVVALVVLVLNFLRGRKSA